MGLDIGAYKNIVKVGDDIHEHDNEHDDVHTIYDQPFKRQLGNLKVGDVYKGEYVHFCSKSYGNYSYFREQLAIIAGYKKQDVPKPHYSDEDYNNKYYYHSFQHIAGIYLNNIQEGDFLEVIVFSDCEGVICADVCAKLYEDFKKNILIAEELLNEYDFKFYSNMMSAFKHGAENGFVNFH